MIEWVAQGNNLNKNCTFETGLMTRKICNSDELLSLIENLLKYLAKKAKVKQIGVDQIVAPYKMSTV